MAASSGDSLRKLTKEILDTSRSAALIGGIKFLADKSNSQLLWWIYFILSGVLLAHVQSYIQVSTFGSALKKRLGTRFYVAQTIGVIIAFALLFTVITLIDQSISAIAAAQLK